MRQGQMLASISDNTYHDHDFQISYDGELVTWLTDHVLSVEDQRHRDICREIPKF